MIVRILGEGQLDVPDDALTALNDLDDRLVKAIEDGDDAAFTELLAALLDHTRQAGTRLPADHLGPSDIILPGPHATRTEVATFLAEDGLVPGT